MSFAFVSRTLARARKDAILGCVVLYMNSVWIWINKDGKLVSHNARRCQCIMDASFGVYVR